jgi:leucyl-tRNA synthetase
LATFCHILATFCHILATFWPHFATIFWHRMLLTIFFGTSSPDCDPDTHPSAPSEFARRSGGSSPR